MPIRKVKSKKQTKSLKKNKIIPNRRQTILDIIKSFSDARNNLSKSRNNLPARLMKLNSSSRSPMSNLESTDFQNQDQDQYQYQNQDPDIFSNAMSKSMSKSMSSSFTSVIQNGQTHSKGKTIINNSTKPFIEIKEIDNGDVKDYMIPKNTIPYKQSNIILINSMKPVNFKKVKKTPIKKTKKTKKAPTKKVKKTKKSPKAKKSKY